MIHTLTTYAQWADYAEAFADGHIPSLIACGSPGLSKTHTLRDCVGDRAVYLKGNLSPLSLYMHAFNARDHGCIVIDDADSVYDGRGGQAGPNILKALLDTEKPSKVSWATQTPILAKQGIDVEFHTNAHVAIISNDFRTTDSHLNAVVNRCVRVSCQFSALEVHRNVGSWWHLNETGPAAYDEEVFDFIEKHLNLIAQPSMRHYVLAAQLKRAKTLDWQAALFETFGLKSDQAAVAKIMADPTLCGEQAVEEFTRKRLGSRAKFYRIKKDLESLARGVPLKTQS